MLNRGSLTSIWHRALTCIKCPSIKNIYLFVYFILFALFSWHLILPSTVGLGYVTYCEELSCFQFIDW